MHRQLGPIWAFSFLFWTAYAVLTVAGLYAVRGLSPHVESKGNLLIWTFGEAYMWVLVTPVIWTVTQRFKISKEKWALSLSAHLAAALAVTVLGSGSLLKIDDIMGWSPINIGFDLRLAAFSLVMFPRYVVTLAIVLLVMYYKNSRSRELKLAQVEGALTEAQLQMLRSQLDPHFLFNTLNSIATLAKKNPAASEQMTLQLATLLRVSLESAAPQIIPLSKELEFLKSYLAIQEVRFGDRLSVQIDVDPDLMAASVPSLIFQPLVENAIRHGIGKSAFPGRIIIGASKLKEQIILEVIDNGVGIDEAKARRSSGVGLRNTQNRLLQLYGGQYRFDLSCPKAGGCHVALTIPLVSRDLRVDHAHPNLDR